MIPTRAFFCTKSLSHARSHWNTSSFSRELAAMPAVCSQRHVLALARKFTTSRRPWSISTPHSTRYNARLQKNTAQRNMRRAAAQEVDDLIPGMQYDPEWNEQYWMTRPVSVTKRLITIGFAIFKWRVFFALNGEEQAAEYLKDQLTVLGPAFVKIGQAVSSRPDVVPPVYIRQLEYLQDDIAPFSSEEAFEMIETDLQRPIKSLFSTISDAPVAAASLGQVYKAQLASDGSTVAVKVQRPRLLEIIALDIFILRNLAKAVRRLRKLNSNLPMLIDDWASSIYREMSYKNEAANAQEFKKLFAHFEEIYVPETKSELSSERVLTMEWIDGTKPRRGSDGGGFDRVNGGGSEADLKLVEVGVRCSLEQMLEEGFYHADPHAGNILRMNDGRLCYLDFGMMGRIDRSTRQALIRATLHMVNREFDALATDFVTLGLLPEDSKASREEIVIALQGIFNEALKDGVSNLNFGGLSANLGTTMYKYKFRIPPYYTLLVRSLTILEGIALASDPNYKVLGAAYPWVARRLLTDTSTELRATLRNLLYSSDGMFRFDRMESLLEQAVRTPPPSRRPPGSSRGQSQTPAAVESGDSSSKGAPSLKLGGILSGKTSSQAGTAAQEPKSSNTALVLLLSDEGEYLRGIMLDELAKGMDAATRLQVDSFSSRLRSALQGNSSNSCSNDSSQGPGSSGGMRAPGGPGIVGWPFGQAVNAVAQHIAQLPTFASSKDVQQVDGVQRLATQLQALAASRTAQRAAQHSTDSTAANGSSGGGSSSSSTPTTFKFDPPPLLAPLAPPEVTQSVSIAAQIMQWISLELSRLSEKERRVALNMPVDFAGRLTSRAAARTVKYLAAVDTPTLPSSSSSSNSKEKTQETREVATSST